MRRRNIFRHALARWGFSGLALFAYANELYRPALLCTVLAFYAWRTR